MSAVSLESRCSDRLVPSPTKLPTRKPRESILTSLATLMESSGAGGLSRNSSPRKRPAPAQPARLSNEQTSSPADIACSFPSDMAVNVPRWGEKRKGFGNEVWAISY